MVDMAMYQEFMLNKFILNKYTTALPEVKELASDVIKLEENFALDLRKFL